MSRVVLDGLDREPVVGCFGRRVDQSRRARERRVGPHVAAHEVFRLVGPVMGFWERRGSDDGGGVFVLQSPIDELEVCLVVLSPHMLKGQISSVEGREEGGGALTSIISTLTKASNRPSHSIGIFR